MWTKTDDVRALEIGQTITFDKPSQARQKAYAAGGVYTAKNLNGKFLVRGCTIKRIQ